MAMSTLPLVLLNTHVSRVTPALAYCENNGFALDTAGWREQAEEAREEERRLKAECDELAPPIPEDVQITGVREPDAQPPHIAAQKAQ